MDVLEKTTPVASNHQRKEDGMTIKRDHQAKILKSLSKRSMVARVRVAPSLSTLTKKEMELHVSMCNSEKSSLAGLRALVYGG